MIGNFPVETLAHSVLRGEKAAAFFNDNWDAMARANPRATVFQTRQWYSAWISAVAAAESAEPVVLRVPASGTPRAALALQISRTPDSHSILRPLSAPWADYHEVAGDPSDLWAAELLAEALLDFARRHDTTLVFDDVKPDGMLASILDRLPCSREFSSTTEAITLDDEDHWTRIQSSNEYALKWRRLNRLGCVRCDHHTDADLVMEKLSTFIDMHRRQWAARPDAVAPFEGGVVDNAFRAIVRHLAPQRMVILTELTLDSKPLAMYFGFLYSGRYLAYRTTYDEAYRRLSPGHLMLRRMMADFRAEGIGELDLMRGAYAYKRDYASRVSRNLRFEMRTGTAPR